MRVLTIPNWSFGRDKDLLRRFRRVLEDGPVEVHYLEGDVDHNRTVSAFSGEAEAVFETLLELARLAFDRIDLNRHVGVHPRIGALDVCPFVTLPSWNVSFKSLDALVQKFAADLATIFELPIFLYERSEKGRHEADLPSLRKGGFGGLIGRKLSPDYGPDHAHPRLGVTILGVRDFLIAMNVNLKTEDVAVSKAMAKQMRDLRQEGDERFLGVRALGFSLVSRQLTQVSMNLTLPDITAPDPIIEWVHANAHDAGSKVAGCELVGVIRNRDLTGATRLPIKPEQIVDRVKHGV